LLNDQVVRLKDVRDLFLGTGAGASAYAIIEQGRVDQILQANAIGRRAVFEEAAGISRYKARKADALRRLERVDQNLLRLTDIVDEVEAQLNSTRSQAAKAGKHRELSKELERWWLGLAADDHRHADAQLTTLRTSLAETQTELDALDSERTVLDGRLGGLDAELGAADDALRAAEREASSAREAITGHEAAARFQSARLEELDAELVRLRRQLTLLSARAAETSAERGHNTAALTSSEAELAQRQSRLAEREEELQESIRRIDADREQIASDRELQLSRLRQVSEAESRIAARSAERSALATALEGVAAKLATLDTELATAEAAISDRTLAVDETEAGVRVRRGRVSDLHTAREKLAASRERLAADLAVLREHRSATAARIAVLEDLLAKGEGIGIGVREILRRARTLGDAPWNRIYGTVADLLDVDLDDAPLLEVALGERAQLVVIEDFETLLPYLGRSSAKISGRVGFLSNRGLPGSLGSEFAGVRYIEARPPRVARDDENSGMTPGADAPGSPASLDPRPSTLDPLHGLPGVIKRADELIRPTSRMPHLATRLLSDTWVVESLPVALKLAAGAGRGMRFVTLAGELLDADGTLVVGTLKADAAILSRRSELLRLRDELTDVDRAIETGVRKQETLGESQAELTNSLAAAESELRSAIDRLNRARAELAEADRKHQRLCEDRKRLADDVAARQTRLDEVSAGIAAAQRERDAARSDLETLETGLGIAQHGVAEEERQLAAIEKELSVGRLDLAKAEERLSGLREAVARLERESSQRAAQRGEAVRRLDAAIAKHGEVVRHLLTTQSQFAEATLRRERHAAAVATTLTARNALKRHRGEFAAAESQLRSRRRASADAHHVAEMAAREQEHRLATLAERIREEYGRELAELADGEHSAIALWLDEGRETKDEGRGTEEETPLSTLNPQLSTHLPSFADLRPELEARVDRLRKKLKVMGAVNADSLSDLDELEERYTRLSGQLQDLVEAKRTLEDVIRRINNESKRLFAETFEQIRGHFQDLFRKLFGGGEGDIVLEDANDILECGIDVVARPPGKELRSLSLLSGGEKTMTCVGLLLAIFKSRPSPFCLLDEVDAALDEANIGRFVGVLTEFKATTQFIMITHRKPSMCEADVLYGVTMEQAGVSKRLNVRFDDVADDGSFRATRRAA
ncbi:MAG: chromosome segregation protein SMC, partial [Planctomycetaceae bacterium]